VLMHTIFINNMFAWREHVWSQNAGLYVAKSCPTTTRRLRESSSKVVSALISRW